MYKTRTPRPTRPATAGQVEWIERKTREHGISYEDMAQRTGHAYEDLTSRTAGTWLDILFNLPPVPVDGAVTDPGLYVHNGVVHRVQWTQDGTRLYPKVWDGSKFVYDRDGVRLSELRADTRLAESEAAAYGVNDKPARQKAARKAVVEAARQRDEELNRQRWYGTPQPVTTGVVAPVPSTDDEVADLLAHFT